MDSAKFLKNIPSEKTQLTENVKVETETNNDVSIFNGVPREHIEKRIVRIFKPAKNAMQSGTNDTKTWRIGKNL